ncbi:MAG: zinc-ribbon domain-containing protein [Verrucomicrobiota bacterium]
MLCSKCGFDNPTEARFCGKCGIALTLVAAVDPVSAPGVSQEMKIGIAIGSFFVPLLGIIMGAMYMNDPNPAKKAVGRLWLFVALGSIALWCVCALIYSMGQSRGF